MLRLLSIEMTHYPGIKIKEGPAMAAFFRPFQVTRERARMASLIFLFITIFICSFAGPAQADIPGWSGTGSLAARREYHKTTLLPNGKVLVTGGRSPAAFYLTIAELYDPATGTWTSAGTMATGRENHTATLLPNGKVLVAGGTGSGYTPLTNPELYDPATNSWTTAGAGIMGTARAQHTATLLGNG